MSCWAVVAINTRLRRKGRLRGVLDAEGRDLLAREMLDAVLAAVDGARSITHVLIVSPDEEGLPEGYEFLHDAGSGLNDAFELALARGRGEAREFVLLPADLPRLAAADVDALVHAGRRTRIAIAPDRLVEDWPAPAAAAALEPRHLEPLLALSPELLVLGTGERQVFPPAAVLAACLTININFPEAAIKDLSKQIEEQVAKEAAAQQEQQKAPEPEAKPEGGGSSSLLDLMLGVVLPRQLQIHAVLTHQAALGSHGPTVRQHPAHLRVPSPNQRAQLRQVRAACGAARKLHGLVRGGGGAVLLARADYRTAWLRGDVVAGLTIWAVLVPEALACATIAGVSPLVGLCAAPPAPMSGR